MEFSTGTETLLSRRGKCAYVTFICKQLQLLLMLTTLNSSWKR